MKSTDRMISEINRRAMLTALTMLPALPMLLPDSATAQSTTSDPLPSWNDTASKKAIVTFVERVTKQGSPDFVPETDRIATFDNHGKFWGWQPTLTQTLFGLAPRWGG